MEKNDIFESIVLAFCGCHWSVIIVWRLVKRLGWNVTLRQFPFNCNCHLSSSDSNQAKEFSMFQLSQSNIFIQLKLVGSF